VLFLTALRPTLALLYTLYLVKSVQNLLNALYPLPLYTLILLGLSQELLLDGLGNMSVEL